MRINIHKNRSDKTTHNGVDVTWDEFCEHLVHEERQDKDGLGFSAALFKSECSCESDYCIANHDNGRLGHMIKANVISTSLFVMDLDKDVDGSALTDDQALAYLRRLKDLGYQAAVYTSHSYDPGGLSAWRIVLPLSRPVLKKEFGYFWSQTVQLLGMPSGIKTDNPARFWYLPSCLPGAVRHSEQLSGVPLDVDEIMEGWVEPTEQDLSDAKEYDFAPTGLLQAAMADLKAHGQSKEDGTAHNKTYQAAAILKNDYALSDEESMILLEHWDSRNVPRWGTEELQRRLDRVEVSADHPYGEKRDAWVLLQHLKKSKEPAVGFAARVETALVDLMPEDYEISEPQPMFLRLGDLMKMPTPPHVWLIDSIMAPKGIFALASEPKTTKSWIAIEMCIAIATGSKFLGQYQAQKGKCAYFFAEDQLASIQTRFKALAQGREIDPDAIIAQPSGRELDLTSDHSCAVLVASVRALGNIDLLVLDPLRDVHSAEENSSDAMSAVAKRMRKISEILDCVVLFVHHSAKAGANNVIRRPGQLMRGASAIHGACDGGLYLMSPGGDGKNKFVNKALSEVKGARSAGWMNITLDVVDDDKGVATDATWSLTYGDDDGASEAVTEIVEAIGQAALRKEDPPTAQDLAKALMTTRNAIEKKLSSAKDQGLVRPNMVGSLAKGWLLSAKGQIAFAQISRNT